MGVTNKLYQYCHSPWGLHYTEKLRVVSRWGSSRNTQYTFPTYHTRHSTYLHYVLRVSNVLSPTNDFSYLSKLVRVASAFDIRRRRWGGGPPPKKWKNDILDAHRCCTQFRKDVNHLKPASVCTVCEFFILRKKKSTLNFFLKFIKKMSKNTTSKRRVQCQEKHFFGRQECLYSNFYTFFTRI